MKRVHLTILVFALILMVLSGYSIAALNLVYNIQFDWYSKLGESFKSVKRDTSFYQFSILNKALKPKFEVIEDETGYQEGVKRIRSLFLPDFKKYIYIYCTLGEVTQIDSNIKFSDMAQRGNTIEIVASMNYTSENEGDSLYYPEDIVRVDRKMFVGRGKTLFVFKNQFGARIGEASKNIHE